MEENIEIKEEADFDNSTGTSIKDIILRQIRKVGDLVSRELTGSYWEKKPVRTADGVMFSEVYHDDRREAYCNAIDFLIDILYPLGDDEFRKYLNKNEGFGQINQEKIDIKEKVKKKRITFQQINIMFDRTDFWAGEKAYSE